MTALEYIKPTFPLSLEDTKTRVSEIVSTNPDKTAGCSYLVLDEPECIVGVLLYRLNVPMTTLREMDKASVTILSGFVPDYVRNAFTPEAREYLGHLQASQDSGDTWSEAFAYADRSMDDN